MRVGKAEGGADRGGHVPSVRGSGPFLPSKWLERIGSVSHDSSAALGKSARFLLQRTEQGGRGRRDWSPQEQWRKRAHPTPPTPAPVSFTRKEKGKRQQRECRAVTTHPPAPGFDTTTTRQCRGAVAPVLAQHCAARWEAHPRVIICT